MIEIFKLSVFSRVPVLKVFWLVILAGYMMECECMPAGRSLRSSDKQRLIVTTDLGGADPDDIQSMIHLLVCSDVIDIEGLISSRAWVNDPDRADLIRKYVEYVGEVLPNLKSHSSGFPDLDYLRSIVKSGQVKAHMDGVGEGKDSPGSEWIIKAVDKKGDKRPVWLVAWGGMNTIAQALWKVSHTRSAAEVEEFVHKIRIYDVLGQDDAGAWIAKTFPDVFYIRVKGVYGWGPSDEWTQKNIQSCKQLGSHYPKRIWATEGDSPSFFYVYANGLNVPECPDYGGWGGRFTSEKVSGIRSMDFVEKSGKDETRFDPYYMYGDAPEGGNSISRWKEHIWNDFAARMLWTTTSDYKKVNHHPSAVVGRDSSLRCIRRKVHAGDDIVLDASRSDDPDGDPVGFNWYVYQEPSTYCGVVMLEGEKSSCCRVKIPDDASGKTIHLVLEVTDKGSPALTAYRRVVIEVK
ncbi:nucleoside hydrolase-like domain-containing protein [uncultured Bacteroides sp.]|uniref:nucleoside hydrolase-like domain-containing protein n=1 Tax=uncultured Bacteroides sp. TaxID=162156 RepID=UPI00260B28C9|nr:nucleoside hydrolase-like domain-containing protein [uncultured Bacteroides sp.]